MEPRARGLMREESADARKLHEGRQFSYERVSAYRAGFIDPATGRFFASLLRERDCPVCGASEHAVVFERDGGTTVKCLDCSMIFLNPCFNEAALEAYYRDLDTGQAQITSNESDFYREIYGLGLDLIEGYQPSGRILDVGCSSGFFLDVARGRGWNTIGIEPGLREAELAREKAHEIHTLPISRVSFAQKMNVVTLWDVFEHIPDGRTYWEQIDAILAPDGLVFLQIPNSDSLAARIMREHSRMHDCLEHVNLYSPATIRLFAESVGYKVAEMRSVISEASVLNNYLNYESPYFGSSSFGTVVLGLLDEATIHDNLLGYKLQVVLCRS